MSSTQSTQSTTTPGFAPQNADLTTAFNDANGALSQAQQAQAPTNYTATMTPDQLATFQSILGYTNGNTTPGSQAAAGNTNTTNGTNATAGALTGLGNYNPSASNNPQSLVDAANSYVAGQNIPAQVAQATQQANEQARDVTLPQIEQNAQMTGNTNSSRTGIADGLVQRGLAENAQNLSGALSSQAFANGLNLAENQANSNNTAALTALTNEGNIGNTTTSTGVNANNSSINNQGALYGLAENAGQGEQQNNQENLTNQQQQYQAAVNDPFAALQNYYGIVGANNWGQTTNGTTTTTPSITSILGGLLGAGGSAAGTAGSLGWKPFATV